MNQTEKVKKAKEAIRMTFDRYGADKTVIASSLSIEDQVLTDMVLEILPKARVFFLDTGRHFQETYDLMERTMERYGLRIEVYAPDREDIERIVTAEGPNFFYRSREDRIRCCTMRKIRPLERVLKTADVWICGLRQEQSITRMSIEVFERDDNYGIAKVNPLAQWSEVDVWQYIRENEVPYSKLYEAGYCSIGCQPCTRAVPEGGDIRSGRWWWEEPEKRECGLHNRKQEVEK